MLLSLLVSISATMSESGSESILAITGKSFGAVPIFGATETAIPLFCKVFVNSVAAPSAGLSGLIGFPDTTPSLIIKAPRGPTSVPLIPRPSDGVNLSAS